MANILEPDVKSRAATNQGQPPASGDVVTSHAGTAGQASPGALSEEQARNGVHSTPERAARHHAEAGRKGARRIHELIQEGLLYEKDHGLKRGRQRIRQLIEEGKLYEKEHGLGGAGAKAEPGRRRRLSPEQSLRVFFEALLRLVQPAHRPLLARLIQELERAKE
jgi:hypothetical protein